MEEIWKVQNKKDIRSIVCEKEAENNRRKTRLYIDRIFNQTNTVTYPAATALNLGCS